MVVMTSSRPVTKTTGGAQSCALSAFNSSMPLGPGMEMSSRMQALPPPGA
jgi:hypothetical protein